MFVLILFDFCRFTSALIQHYDLLLVAADENLSVFGPNFRLWGIFQGLDINFELSTPKKVHPCVRPRRSSHRA